MLMVRRKEFEGFRKEVLGELDKLRTRVGRLESDALTECRTRVVAMAELEERIDTLFKRANDLGSKVIRVEGMLEAVIRVAGARLNKKKLNSKK